mgnify:CR=1 FL=1
MSTNPQPPQPPAPPPLTSQQPQQPQQLQPLQPQQYPPQPMPPKGWWGRNWKWFLPVGCLSMMLITVGLIALIIWGVISAATGAMKSSDAYRKGVAMAVADPRVAAALGRPIKEEGMPSGSISVHNSTGHADIRVTLVGPKGKGTLHIVANKARSGDWEFWELYVDVQSTGQEINLLHGNARHR